MAHIRKVDVRLPGKGNSNSHGARPVHLIITMIKWIRTSRLSIKNSLSLENEVPCFPSTRGHRDLRPSLPPHAVPGFIDAAFASSRFNGPASLALALDGGAVFVVDSNNHALRLLNLATGNVTTLVGSGQGFANGGAGSASFSFPRSIALSQSGTTAWVADTGNHAIREITLERFPTAGGSVSWRVGGVATLTGQPFTTDPKALPLNPRP